MEGPRLVTKAKSGRRRALLEVVASVATPALASLIAHFLASSFGITDLVMVYLLGVVVLSTRVRLGLAVFSAILSVLVFDYFFVPPYLGFAVVDPKHLVTLGVMLFVAITISGLVTRLKHQTQTAQDREQRTAALYAMSHGLAAGGSGNEVAKIASDHVARTFARPALLLRPSNEGKLLAGEMLGDGSSCDLDAAELAVAQAVFESGNTATESNTHHRLASTFVPMRASGKTYGVLCVRATPPSLDEELRKLLETFAALSASALERAELSDAAQHAHVQMEAEQLKGALLGSVSHDLRTPLAVITGAASTLLDSRSIRGEAGVELASTILDEAEHLSRLVNNLLDMTRLEAGAVHLRREWQPIDEVVGAALTRVETRLGDRPVELRIPEDLPLLLVDSVLVAQVLINLLENAIKYTPADSPIAIRVECQEADIMVEVSDQGPGIPPGEELHIFDKFCVVKQRPTKQGVGLGLAICRAIVKVHGGRIWVEPSAVGARFRFTLPLEGSVLNVDLSQKDLEHEDL